MSKSDNKTGWRNDYGHEWRGGVWYDDRGYTWNTGSNVWIDPISSVQYPGPSPIIIYEDPITYPVNLPAPGPITIPSIPIPSIPSIPIPSIPLPNFPVGDDLATYCKKLNVDTKDLPK
jgi:hypothetical protein